VKTLLGSALALVLALLMQMLFGYLAPAHLAWPDPFLLVLVYSALQGGEVRGLLMGTACGWVQDVLFGGPIVGLSALSKLLVGFGVGLAGARFMVVGPGPRGLVLFCAALLDLLLYERLAAMLGLVVAELPLAMLLLRAGLSALLGAPLFGLLERRLGHEALP